MNCAPENGLLKFRFIFYPHCRDVIITLKCSKVLFSENNLFASLFITRLDCLWTFFVANSSIKPGFLNLAFTSQQ